MRSYQGTTSRHWVSRVVLGRTFVPEEDSVPDARPVMIVSHRLWQTKLAGNQQVIGQTLRLNSRAFTIVGVAPP